MSGWRGPLRRRLAAGSCRRLCLVAVRRSGQRTGHLTWLALSLAETAVARGEAEDRQPQRLPAQHLRACRRSHLFGWLGAADGTHARKHEAAQRAEFAFDQADAALLARNDDEQGNDGGKADQTLKHAAPPNQAQLSLTNARGQTAAVPRLNALPDGRQERSSMFRGKRQRLTPLSLTIASEKASEWADCEVTCRQLPNARGILGCSRQKRWGLSMPIEVQAC